MVKLRTRDRTTGAGRGGRKFRSLAALLTTSLLAPAAVAGVATTVGTTITAAPAAAAPTRTFVVSGDAATRNGGAWVFWGPDYSQLRSIITSASNFGPTGTVKSASFSLGPQIDAPITDAKLAGIDVFVSGAITPGYSSDEQAALQRFVNRGGFLLLNTNSAEFDTSSFYGFSVQDPQAIFEPGLHPGISITNPANGVISGPYAAPAPAQATGTHPIIQGPFGTVTTFQNWHTVTGFTTVPPAAQVLARLTTTCSSNCTGPTPPPTTTTGAGPTTTVAGPTTTAPPPEHPWNQVITNLPVLAVIPPITVSGVRHGAVIVSSDVDTYSNHSSADDPATTTIDETEIYANPMLPGNERLAKNIFAYVANQLTEGYTSLTPSRVMDTRDGTGLSAAGKVTASGTRTLQITGRAGIPADATAVALNVTAVNPTEPSFISVYPRGAVADGTTPNTSNLNFNPGQAIPNMVTVSLPADGSGQITFFNERGSVDILADVVGYYAPSTESTIRERFNATPRPDRILDTRLTATPFVGGTPRSLQISGSGAGYVPSGATAVVLNVTSVNNTAGGYLTVYPGDVTTPPTASNLNFVPGAVVPNMVISKLSPSGTVNIFNFAGTTDVVVDVLGYFVGDSTGGAFGAVTPARVLDTRSGTGVTAGTVNAGQSITLNVFGKGGVPSSGVRAVLLNVTAAAPSENSFITVWPGGATRPNSSNLNTVAGVNVPNLVVVGVDSSGNIQLYNNAGSVHLIADVLGYYS